MKASLAFLAAIAVRTISALPQAGTTPIPKSRCPPFSGNFTINQYQLYPENLDFDTDNCLLYLGCLWNATVGVYDPYAKKMVDILQFPGISHNPNFHIGGVAVDERTGLLSIVVDAGDAFNSFGANISGTNYIMQWDPAAHALTYKINLTQTTQGKYGGYQDVQQDPDDNVYVVGTYPGSILKVSCDGKTVTPWYEALPDISTNTGLTGLASKDWLLLASDFGSGQLWKFDMRAAKGVPYVIPTTPPQNLSLPDAISLPNRYSGTVLLVAEDFAGVKVFRSKDGLWNAAEYLGLIPFSNPTSSLLCTSVKQIGSAIYMNLIPFGDSAVPGTAGNASHFFYPDITAQVDALLV